MKTISIAVPVRNEVGNLDELITRILQVKSQVTKYNFEVLFIDNGSTDGSTGKIVNFCKTHENFKFIKFTRDFGIEASFDAGAKHSSGEALIYLFSDLQDPPELIPAMIEKWEEGYDLVYGKLNERNDSIVFKSFGAKIAYQLITQLTNKKIPKNATDFRLLSRKIIDYLNSFGESSRYMRGITHWSGVNSCPIEYSRSPRRYGKSKAGLIFCIRYAIDAISSFSTKPLRISAVAGFILISLSILLGLCYLLNSIFATFGVQFLPIAPRGWSTLVVLNLFFGGINSFFIAILGEYIAKIHTEVKRRPLWLIEDMNMDLK